MSDYALTVLGGPLLELLEQRAPNVKLRISPVDPAAVDEGSSALRAVDLMVLPRGYLRDLPSAELYRDSWVGVTATDNDNVGEVVGDHELQTLRWILTYNRPTQFTPPDHHLQLAGIERHVDVVIENFLALPFLLTGTKRIGVLQERLARKLPGRRGAHRSVRRRPSRVGRSPLVAPLQGIRPGSPLAAQPGHRRGRHARQSARSHHASR